MFEKGAGGRVPTYQGFFSEEKQGEAGELQKRSF